MKSLVEIQKDLAAHFDMPPSPSPLPLKGGEDKGEGVKFPITQIAIEGLSLVVPKERWFELANFLKTAPEYSFDFLSSVTGVDYKEYLEVVYHFYSMEKKEGPLTIKVRTDVEKSMLPSLTPIWRSAEFQEREAYDLIGIHFEGHPDLRRILMWEGFEHHPLRKSYVQEDQDRPL